MLSLTCFSWPHDVLPLASTVAVSPLHLAAHQDSVRGFILFWKAEISQRGMQGGSVRWAWTLTPQMMCQIYFLNTCDLLNPTPQYFILPPWNRRMNKTVFSTPGPYVISFALLVYSAMDCLILNELVHEHLIYYISVVDRIFGGETKSFLILKARKIKRSCFPFQFESVPLS